MRQSDPFPRSLLAMAAWQRVLGALALSAVLWIAVTWAVALP